MILSHLTSIITTLHRKWYWITHSEQFFLSCGENASFYKFQILLQILWCRSFKVNELKVFELNGFFSMLRGSQISNVSQDARKSQNTPMSEPMIANSKYNEQIHLEEKNPLIARKNWSKFSIRSFNPSIE